MALHHHKSHHHRQNHEYERLGKGWRHDVDIIKFDTSYYFNKEAHAHLDVAISDAKGQVVYEEQVRNDREKGGVGAGIFGDVEALANFANRTLNEAIDEVLSDQELRTALQSLSATSIATQGDEPAEALTVAQRLERLERLESSGLLSEQEFRDKRAELVESL